MANFAAAIRAMGAYFLNPLGKGQDTIGRDGNEEVRGEQSAVQCYR